MSGFVDLSMMESLQNAQNVRNASIGCFEAAPSNNAMFYVDNAVYDVDNALIGMNTPEGQALTRRKEEERVRKQAGWEQQLEDTRTDPILWERSLNWVDRQIEEKKSKNYDERPNAEAAVELLIDLRKNLAKELSERLFGKAETTFAEIQEIIPDTIVYHERAAG